jgi:hypothetical protein
MCPLASVYTAIIPDFFLWGIISKTTERDILLPYGNVSDISKRVGNDTGVYPKNSCFDEGEILELP